ncbi:MAG TPA: redoxin domain-containing protein [Methanocella sp.]|uniref:peroxiredoxin n=1 Tax=Methanocella sp. TaxID=2052833 RepID=UPI002C598299|nr:redoxin domain-containing protein [Methanocella sp.]HTY89962.1 redoxin domain-containing protein [Methanocella sp.]
MLKINEKVPDFEAEAYQNDRIRKIKFSDYRGKWMVLVFYPGDFTFVCPTELQELGELYDDFKKEGSEVLSVSKDTVFVHKAWHDNSPAIQTIKYPMVADPSGKICREFGTLTEDEGLSLRGSFVIDPDGFLKCLEIQDTSIGRSMHELLRKLQAARFVREHKGRACPASWQPGEETLKPGLNLVGKI